MMLGPGASLKERDRPPKSQKPEAFFIPGKPETNFKIKIKFLFLDPSKTQNFIAPVCVVLSPV